MHPPADRSAYTSERHVAWLSSWLTTMGLRDITLFCQDWGGLLGWRLPVPHDGHHHAAACVGGRK
jgi:haloalkane dehalogenase